MTTRDTAIDLESLENELDMQGVHQDMEDQRWENHIDHMLEEEEEEEEEFDGKLVAGNCINTLHHAYTQTVDLMQWTEEQGKTVPRSLVKAMEYVMKAQMEVQKFKQALK